VLIDWFTVGAQAINFLVLIWLLKRFLYQPVLKAIDAREKRIADSLSDAARKQAAAQKDLEAYQAKNRSFDEQRDALFAQAAKDAGSERDRLLAQARQQGEELRARQVAALQSERSELGAHLARLAGAEVFAIARKALADLGTISLEERIVEVFTRRLRDLNADGKAALGTAIGHSAEPALIRSRFDLPGSQQAAIRNALNETFSAEIRVGFETSPDALCGVELLANGQKLAWSIEEYLGALERQAGALLDAHARSAVAAVPDAAAPISADVLAIDDRAVAA